VGRLQRVHRGVYAVGPGGQRGARPEARLPRGHRRAADALARPPRDAPAVAVRRASRSPTRSTFEDVFLVFVERYELPRPEVNQWVAGYEVDAIWRAQRLIVELDSRTFQDHDDPFERDREKDADLIAAGYRAVRVTWQRLVHHPAREAERFAALLDRSP
jgi:very-short-patch-repair endonuclease